MTKKVQGEDETDRKYRDNYGTNEPNQNRQV